MLGASSWSGRLTCWMATGISGGAVVKSLALWRYCAFAPPPFEALVEWWLRPKAAQRPANAQSFL